MPDNVCTGHLRYYNVDSNPVQHIHGGLMGLCSPGLLPMNLFIHGITQAIICWKCRNVSPDGCLGPVRSLCVVVTVSIYIDLTIPEAFSPNSDLINDVWNIGNIEAYPKAQITIYNRWGQSVWRSEQGYPQPWDGKSNGVSLPVDSYHYVINLHNGSKQIVGSITIVK